ncbi:hypothetical protein HDU98_005884 [Podochytrium sp. JEL0797]|nr:hypothetical protein HDU98_005884 [Podochytrium sp. JEL0797]
MFVVGSVIVSGGSILILDAFYATSFYLHIKSLGSTGVEPKLRIIAVYGLWSCGFAFTTFAVTGFALLILVLDPELDRFLTLFIVLWIVKDFLCHGVGWTLLLMRMALTRCDSEDGTVRREGAIQTTEPQTRNATILSRGNTLKK